MSELTHYGVLGMKWGVRRYQNKDGSLTSLGKKQKEYEAIKKQGKTGYRESIGSGAYAVWPNKRTFRKAVNKNTKQRLKNAKSLSEKMQIKNEASRYKQRVDIDNMLIRSAYKEQAKLVKDSMKAETKGIPRRQVTKGRHHTERILQTVGAVSLSAVLIVGGGIGLAYLDRII